MYLVKTMYKQFLQLANKIENINIKNWTIRKIKDDFRNKRNQDQMTVEFERLKRIEQIYNLYYKQNEYKYTSILSNKISNNKTN